MRIHRILGALCALAVFHANDTQAQQCGIRADAYVIADSINRNVVSITTLKLSLSSNAATASVNQRLARVHAEHLSYTSGVDSLAAPLEITELVRLFLTEAGSVGESDPSAVVREYEATDEVVRADSILCIRHTSWLYNGGPYGRSITRYIYARCSDGSDVTWQELIPDTADLYQRAERALRAEIEMLPDDRDYLAAGFCFDQNRFTLPKEIGVLSNSIELAYGRSEFCNRVLVITIPKE